MTSHSQDTRYFQVSLQTILVNSIRSFDIYLPIKGKMNLYHAGGESFTAEVKENLLQNKIETLFLSKSDRDAYNTYVEENLEEILKNPDLSAAAKAEVAHSSISNIAKTLFENPRSQTIIRYKTAIKATMDFIMKENSAVTNLIRLTSHDFTTYIHSVNVGIFAIGLAKTLLSHDSSHNMYELASGFFLHDIGKCSTPVNVLNKPGPLDEDEWKIMRRHPFEGYRLLEQLNALTKESRVIVMEHHERHDGKGYPRRLKGDQIHIYSKICCIADVFDALTSVRPYKEPNTPFQALQIMKEQMRSEFDPIFFERFVLLFGQGRYSQAYQKPSHVIKKVAP